MTLTNGVVTSFDSPWPVFAEDPQSNILIELKQGWNLVSFPLILDNASVEYVFEDIMGEIIIVNSFEPGYGARTYDPLLPMFSDLISIDEKSGYWIKVSEDVNLSLSGEEVINKTIDLSLGWNLISYLVNAEQDIEIVLADIMDKIIIVNSFESDYGARTYDPKLPMFSDLLTMQQKYGYWIKINESVGLEY